MKNHTMLSILSDYTLLDVPDSIHGNALDYFSTVLHVFIFLLGNVGVKWLSNGEASSTTF